MDDLSRFIFWRIKCRFHPYILPETGWRLYPTHVASLLESLEPLHIIAIGPTWLGVDGAFIDHPGSHGEKLDLAVEVADALFGEAKSRTETKNLEVFKLNTGLTRFHLYDEGVWYVVICADVRPYPSRFAYLANQYRLYTPQMFWIDGAELYCVVATADGVKAGFYVSRKFFQDPKPENATLFGDLLFLAQAESDWSVEGQVDVVCTYNFIADWAAYIAYVLRQCRGLRSFIRHAYKELLLREPNECSAWRTLLTALERRDGEQG